MRKHWNPRWMLTMLFTVLLAALAMPLGLSADVVILKNGNRLEGKILEETPEKVVLQMEFGTMDFPRDQVKEIQKRALPETKPAADQKPPVQDKPKDEPKPGTAPGAEKPPGAEKAPAVEKTPAASVTGTVFVSKEAGGVTRKYVMDVKDAVAIWYEKDPNKMLVVAFLPFKLSPEEIKQLAEAKGDEVFSIVRSKPSPDPRQWDDCPYAGVNIRFVEGKAPAFGNISDYHLMFFGLVYSNESYVQDESSPKAKRDIPKLNLSMEEKEGTLEMSFNGTLTGTREISQPTQTHKYTWRVNVKCKVFAK